MIIIYITREEKKSKSNEEISKELNIDFFINNVSEAEENEIWKSYMIWKIVELKQKKVNPVEVQIILLIKIEKVY